MSPPDAQRPDESSGKRRNRPYTGAGIAIGVGVGVALGVAADNIAVGIALGVALGLVFSAATRRL